jgi:hypothetical protein
VLQRQRTLCQQRRNAMTFKPYCEICKTWHDGPEGHVNERAVMLAALKAVEDWWLTQGMKHFGGAPYAIFATRDAIAMAEGKQVVRTEPVSEQ